MDPSIKKENGSNGGVEVVLTISSGDEPIKPQQKSPTSTSTTPTKSSETNFIPPRNSNVGGGGGGGGGYQEFDRPKIQMTSFCPSPEISRACGSPRRPPKVPDNITPRRALARSAFWKPKSRFVEPSAPSAADLVDKDKAPPFPFRTSPTNRVAGGTPRAGGGTKTAPVSPKTPFLSSPGGEEDEDEEIYKIDKGAPADVTSLCSLTVHRLQRMMMWGLEQWKWCVMVMDVVCGRLVTAWIIHVLVFLIEKNFLFKKKVLYFVYGLKKSVQIVIWLSLVLLSWTLLFNRGVKRSRSTTKFLDYVSTGIISLLVGSVIWLVKTLLVKMLAGSFHVNTFFDRIQESIFHQYVLQTLSGPPMMELAEQVGAVASTRQLSFRSTKTPKGAEAPDVIDVNKLNKMKQEKVSAWTMKGLVNVIRTSGLSTISNTIDQIYSEHDEQKDKEITSEWEAKAAAYRIFRNVAKPNSKQGYRLVALMISEKKIIWYIDEDDLMRFLSKEEVDNVLPLFEGAVETGKIKKSSLRNWVVKVYLERKSLAHSLNDTKTAVRQLNKLVSGAVIVIMIIVMLLIMGFLTTKVVVFMSSQMLLVDFMFGNTAKQIFEAIIFVFVMHPFDVGDRCVVDGVRVTFQNLFFLSYCLTGSHLLSSRTGEEVGGVESEN
ncbi:hypothetical protein C5167_031352 [Papaver somniferum]|uniref:Mechanosensitive ion channel protein n=1 Tax=Papaver somniferum TaxID=3469 RepID=A0A4Y7K6Y3_PAPSO|nr:hypothetical protein C5167_031352 [Papaver somniferum]